MELAVFGTTLFVALPFFFIVSVLLIALIKMMGFIKPSVFRMSAKYFVRWIGVSIFASLLTAYLTAQELGAGDYTYVLALFSGLFTGTLFLLALDLLAIRARD